MKKRGGALFFQAGFKLKQLHSCKYRLPFPDKTDTEDRTRACRVELTTLENSIARSQGIGLGSNPEPGNSYWLDFRNVMGQ